MLVGCADRPSEARVAGEPARLELVATIRSSDSLPFDAADAGVTLGRRIVILDSDAWQMLTFDTAGRLLHRTGRQGSGPGEIRVAKDLEVAPNGMIAIADVGNGRIGFWDAEGNWIGHSTLRAWVHDLAWTPAGLFAKQESAEGIRMRQVFPDDSSAATVANDVPGGLLPRTLIDSTGMSWEFGAVDVLPGGRALFAYPDSIYAVLETDSTGRVHTTFQRRDVVRIPLSAQERGAIEARFRNAAARRPGLRMPDPPEFKKFILDIAADSGGRLWILRSTLNGADAEFDLFARDGAFLGTVSVATPARRMEIQGEYLIAYGESEAGESVVTLFTY